MLPVLNAHHYITGTAKSVRQSGRVPAVIYGHGFETINISIDHQEFRKSYKKVGKATLLEIHFEKKKIPVLIHELDLHPVSGDPIHVDFHAVRMDEPVHATVPVHIVGNSDAVKLLAGILTVHHESIEIKCLPKYLMTHIDLDISPLKTFHDSLSVSDLDFPKEITVLNDPETSVASVLPPRVGNADSGEEGGEEEEKEEETK